MSVVFNDVDSNCHHNNSTHPSEAISSIIDYNRCERLLDSMEKYSKKLDILVEKTANIEKTYLRNKNG